MRRYVAYLLSYRQIKEMEEHGVEVDHFTLHRWVLKYVPLLETVFLARKRPVGGSSRMDETYVHIKGVWQYLYRVVDKAGATVDFLLTAGATARRRCGSCTRRLPAWYFPEGHDRQSGANIIAVDSYNTAHYADIEICQVKILNNTFEQEHQAIKRMTRQMVGFRRFWSAGITLTGIEILHMNRKGQLYFAGKLCRALQFYSLAG